MKTLLTFVISLCFSSFVFALELRPEQVEGAWKIVQMGNDPESGEDLWEFNNGRFTQNLEGHRMASDAYKISGNKLDLGYASINVLEFDGQMMKAKFGPVVYKLEKVSDKVVVTPKPKKEVSAEAKKMAQEMAAAMMSNVSEGAELNCEKSVKNSHLSIDTMLGVGEKNYNGGYISKEQYEATVGQLKGVMAEITLEDCQKSTGKQKQFYTCMSNDNNMFMSCAQKYM